MARGFKIACISYVEQIATFTPRNSTDMHPRFSCNKKISNLEKWKIRDELVKFPSEN